MTTKERWEAMNQNKANGNSQPKIQQVSYNKELFDDLKSSVISVVTQISVDYNQVNNNDNSNAGNVFEGRNEAKRQKTGSKRD